MLEMFTHQPPKHHARQRVVQAWSCLSHLYQSHIHSFGADARHDGGLVEALQTALCTRLNRPLHPMFRKTFSAAPSAMVSQYLPVPFLTLLNGGSIFYALSPPEPIGDLLSNRHCRSVGNAQRKRDRNWPIMSELFLANLADQQRVFSSTRLQGYE